MYLGVLWQNYDGNVTAWEKFIEEKKFHLGERTYFLRGKEDL